MRHVALMLLLGVLPLPSLAQEAVPPPTRAVYLGGGNHYGWLGGGAELYLPGVSLSVFGGLGVAPQGPTVAAAGGVRYYLALGASSHRLLGDVSLSLMHLSEPTALGGQLSRDYGVGLSFGYSYLAPSGFTVIAGGGVGAWEFGADFDLLPVAHLGVGWTWLR